MKRISIITILLLLAAMPSFAAGYTKNVAIVIYQGVEILDFAGPAEVFSSASFNGANGSERAFNVYTVSKTKAPIVSQGFIDVTTFYNAIPGLTEQFPKARVQPGRRFIDNGKIITTAGVSAGIDGSLHLVARTLGRWVADRTAEYMEYAWSPQSYTSSKYPQLNPRLDAHGKRLQEATIANRGGDVDGAVAIYRELIAKDKTDSQAWLSLGLTTLAAKRYPDAIAALTQAANAEPIKGRAYYNLACAYALTGEKDKAIEAVGRAIEAGFRSKGNFEGDPDLKSIREDGRFRQLMASL
jgi:tetratricopeptide repeat protein